MSRKFLKFDRTTKKPKEESAITSSSGVGDADKLVATGADGLIDQSLLPATEVWNLPCSEGLTAGNFVNIWNDSGVAKVRKADATNIGKRAMGFVLATYTTGATVKVYGEGLNTQLSGLTIGETYHLSDSVAGTAVTTVPTAADTIWQTLGEAVSTTSIRVQINPDPIILLAL
jgi:hypothetical protein